MERLRFLKKLEDKDTNLVIKKGDIIEVDEYEDKELGKYHYFTIHEQKYCLPEKYNKGQFEVLRKEDI